MALRYKFDVLTSLKTAGYTTYRLRVDKLLNEAAVQQLRENKIVSWENLNNLCKYLNCQPGDIIEHFEDTDEE